MRCEGTGNDIVVVGSGVKELGNRSEGSGRQGSLSAGDDPFFEALFEGSGGRRRALGR